MTQEHAESQLRMIQRFRNFWSSVSKLTIGKDVKPSINEAIVRGMETAYGKEQDR